MLHAVPQVTHWPMPLHVMPIVQPGCVPIGSSRSSLQTHCAPLRARMPVLHTVGFVLHAPPRLHATQLPAAQKPPVQLVPSITSVPFSQVCVPLTHDVMPCRHGFVFVLHAWPPTHATHCPIELQTWFVPQLAPGGRFPMPSLHVGDAPVQSREPLRHGVGFPVHAAPCTHMPHTPLLHVWPMPHGVPLLAFCVPSTHTGRPELHSVTPCLHTSGLPVHIAPAVHGMHAPLESQTLSCPQLVPGFRFAVVSSHTDAPVLHDVTPCLHGVGLPVHASISLHATHMPAGLQTRSAPHESPAIFGVPSTHVGAAPLQRSSPFLHASGFVEHAAPSMHVMHAPEPSQIWLLPQLVPPGLFGPSMHAGTPLPHSSCPSRQAFELPVHAPPCAQSMHAPAGLQTLSVPHGEPAIRCIAVSVHAGAAPLQSSAPTTQRFGFVPHGLPCTHAVHMPLAHTFVPPHEVPSSSFLPSSHCDI